MARHIPRLRDTGRRLRCARNLNCSVKQSCNSNLNRQHRGKQHDHSGAEEPLLCWRAWLQHENPLEAGGEEKSRSAAFLNALNVICLLRIRRAGNLLTQVITKTTKG